jgi:hypothetical protein
MKLLKYLPQVLPGALFLGAIMAYYTAHYFLVVC